MSKENNLTVCYKLSYVEPFLDKEDKLVFSISDNYLHNNCEMFLLPDNCLYNNKINLIPFSERLKTLECIIKVILDKVDEFNLFIGDSGLEYSDFLSFDIKIEEFASIANKYLNSTIPIDIHFKIFNDR